MIYLVLGSGRMGKAIVYDLIYHQKADKVILGDRDLDKAIAIQQWMKSPKVEAVEIDVTNIQSVISLMKGVNAVISAVVYQFNPFVAEAAIEAGIPYCDLGQNVEVLEHAFDLQDRAIKKNITLIPGGGLAPGMVNIIAAHGIKHFDEVHEVTLRVGGLPQHPTPPLSYAVTWSIHGLINEYSEKARVLRNKKVIEVDSLTELETMTFPPPFNTMEAFITSGGVSTLPLTYQDKIREINYKTIRYPNHYIIIKSLIQLGLAEETKIKVDGVKIAPRKVLEMQLKNHLTSDKPEDVILLRVTIRGFKKGSTVNETYDLIDYYDPETGLTAMMRTTGFSIAIVAGMIARGEIKKYGVLTQEESIPTKLYLSELDRRNIKISFGEKVF